MTQNKSLAVEAGVMGAELFAENSRLREAIKRILAEPYGCPFCDSGKLRNLEKAHDRDCGFWLGNTALYGPTPTQP